METKFKLQAKSKFSNHYICVNITNNAHLLYRYPFMLRKQKMNQLKELNLFMYMRAEIF